MDIGNLHVIDYYLHEALQEFDLDRLHNIMIEPDFDISTEQREGWAYESNSV